MSGKRRGKRSLPQSDPQPIPVLSATHDAEKLIQSQIDSLIRKRTSSKSKLSRFLNYLNRVIETENTNHATIVEIETRLHEIEAHLLSEFTNIHSELQDLDPERFTEDELEEFEGNYFKIISETKSFLSVNFKPAPSHSQEPLITDGGLLGGESSTITNRRPAVKLPIIELPKFSGHFDKWLEFRDLYLSLVHDNSFLAPIEKFQYLKASLEGSAAHCIQAITICSDNYQMAWDIICQRFQNKRLIVHNHIKSLFNIFEIKGESSNSFRTIVDIISKNIRSLEIIGINTNDWDPLIIYLVTSKLDVETIKEWERVTFQNDLPTLAELKSFLLSRAEFFDKVSIHKSKSIKKTFLLSDEHNQKKGFTCYHCKQEHAIYKCSKFLALAVQERLKRIEALKLCPNCLQTGHKLAKCRSSRCRHCNGNHNSLLHPNDSIPGQKVSSEMQVSLHNKINQGQVLLATAIVQAFNSSGEAVMCRVLLDSASMSNFISQEFADRLGISLNKVNSSVMGLGQSHSNIKASCHLKIKSCHSKFQTKFNCLVIPQITSELPNSYFDPTILNIPTHCTLADPKFYEPGTVDLLIGVEVFWEIVGNEKISLGPDKPIVHNSKLGWFVSGPMNVSQSNRTFCNFSKTSDIQVQLAKFWELEEVPFKVILSDEETQAEIHFSESFQRDPDGRFIVSVPLKQPAEVLGDSYKQAYSQFLSLERKLSKNDKFKKMYIDFMTEYQDLNHMTPFVSSPDQITYFSPHHGVLREDSSTTKLRVVFNSSATSTSGLSYNSIQMVGPVVQDDLISIAMRFRQHQIVFSADVCKMYRQIRVKDEFRPLQLILWRADPKDELQTFSLNTVTYGTASAPFLATRCLKQLAIDKEKSHPVASQIISRDFYVDDLLSGADSLEEAVQLCNDVFNILKSGCFILRKWKSNNKNLLERISTSESLQEYFFGSSETNKILGMQWSCESDTLQFNISSPSSTKRLSKRVILSEVAKIYDPLGLISPVVIKAKVLLQNLWSQQLSWDEPVSGNLAQRWTFFRSNLHELNALQISRKVVCANPQSIQLHGFSDASNSAYGACIYIRSIDSNNSVFVQLLTSKTRVAPLKTVTTPRLELCGALILAQLYEKVRASVTLKIDEVFFWCDSTVTLAWLKCPPNNLQIFVANRVATIQGLTPINRWRYVPTEYNPADILSRGMSPKDIANSSIWFHGPHWLKLSSDEWPANISNQKPLAIDDIPEIRKATQTFVEEVTPEIFPFTKFSSFPRLIRVAHILRFRHYSQTTQQKSERKHGPLRILELRQAREFLVKIAQRESFSVERLELMKKGTVSNKSRIIHLSPFIDDKGIMRVGGRLKHSSYPFNTKHPAILSSKHLFTILLFRHEHRMLLHSGPQLLLSHIRQNYWPIAGTNRAKQTVRECIVCYRFNPTTPTPLMGNLPKVRVSPSLPFSNIGIDYAGPFQFKDRKGKGCKVSKCYLALFICLSTKAVHLEVVSDLSTPAFLETFHRLIARRGRPSKVYSDNGTNFVGAHNQLRELGIFLKQNQMSLQETCGSNFDLEWHFIPAYSPHHGGIWEAGVKSAKHHLKRVLVNTILTFESLYTVVTQIEGILNSRPLTPLSADPNDLEALTPAHFLIGRSIQTIPHPDVLETPTNRLSHFKQLERLRQHFWSRWNKEFIGQLQERVKWKTKTKNISIGTMVLVRDDNLPPSQWRLGRIVNLHPGDDNIVRVVSIKTTIGIIKRSVLKVCPLPMDKQ